MFKNLFCMTICCLGLVACTPEPVAGPDRTLSVPSQVAIHEQILRANGCIIHKSFKGKVAEVYLDCDDSKMTSGRMQVVERAFDNLGRSLQMALYYMPHASNQKTMMQSELDSVQRYYNHNLKLMRNRVTERERPTPPRHRKP